MSKTDSLKSRFQALNVRKPSSYQPQAPRKEVPVKETAKIEDAPVKQTQLKTAESEHPQKQTAHSELAQNEHSINLQATDFVELQIAHKHSAGHREHPQIEHAKNECAPYENTDFQKARSELAHSDSSKESEKISDEETHGQPKGYFKLSHDVFWNPILRSLSGDCFRLFLWMSSRAWRFPNSDGTVRASVRFITDQTGIARATVTRSLKLLRETDLITAKVNHRDGNMWFVQPSAVGQYIAPKNQDDRKQHAQNENAHFKNTDGSNRDSSVLTSSKQSAQIEANINYDLISTKKTSLSADDPENLRLYFKQVKPFRKRQAEWKNFCELLTDYTKTEIAACLEYLQKYGLPHNNETSHSPFAFLAVSMQQVLTSVSKNQQKALQAKAEQQRKAQQLAQEESEKHKTDKAIEAFSKMFPTEAQQSEAIERYKQDSEDDISFLPDFVIRNRAAVWLSAEKEHK